MSDLRETIRVSIDYGTVNASMAAWITRNGEQPPRVWQIPIHGTGNGHRNTPQILAYIDGVLHHGEKLKLSVQNRAVLEDRTIRRLKLYLYPAYRDSDSGKRIREQLEEAGKWDYQIIGEHLKWLLSLVKPFFKKVPDGIDRSATEIDDMEMTAVHHLPLWDENGQLPKNVTLADPLPKVFIPFEELGYRSSTNKDGQKWFNDVKMETCLIISSREVRVRLKVFPCATAPNTEEGQVRGRGARGAGWTIEKPVWSEWKSNVVRDNPEQQHPRAVDRRTTVLAQHQRVPEESTAREEETQTQRQPDSDPETLFVSESPRPAASALPGSSGGEAAQSGTASQEHPATPQDAQVEHPQDDPAEEPENTSRPVARRSGTWRSRHQLQREANAEAASAKAKGKK